MNLKQLEAFVQVAEGGSFSKAAKQLFLTQPTISAHISSLEKELNARFFVRNTKELLKFLFRINKHIDNSNNPEQNRHHCAFLTNRIQIKPITQKQDSCDNNSPHNST